MTHDATSAPDAAPAPDLDREELDLLSRTAHDAFRGGIDGPALGALGWLGLLTDDRRGGSGWHPAALASIVEAAGAERAAFDPIAANLVAHALASSPSPSRDTPGRLARTLAGEAGTAVIADPSLRVSRTTDLRVTGQAEAIVAGPADDLTIAVVTSPHGPVLLVDSTQPGVAAVAPDDAARRGVLQAGVHDTERPLVSVTFTEASASAVPGLNAATFLDVGRALSCADTVGTFARANRALREYLVDRLAFGAPIASFQAIQHRLVDLSLFEAAAAAITREATSALAHRTGSPSREAALAHAYVHGQAVRVLDECVQLSGGIGFTWEHPLHHAQRRAIVNRSRFGSIHDVESAYAAAAGWGNP